MWISVNAKYSPMRETYDSVDEFLAMCQGAFQSKPSLRYVPNKNCWVDEDNEIVLVPPSLREVLAQTREDAKLFPVWLDKLALLSEGFDEVRSRCHKRGDRHITLNVSSDDPEVLIDLTCWMADDGSDPNEFAVETAQEAAEAYCDYPDIESTKWFNVRVWRRGFVLDEDNNVVELEIDAEELHVVVHPPEPSCGLDEHDWRSPHSVVGGVRENPGVFGNGGGAKITEVCRYCGTYKTTDTWATNPVNGEQGLTSITYRAPDEVSAEWVQRTTGYRTAVGS